AEGYRLHTEMEWMFAAKGGNQSKGYTYSGSNTVGNVAWYYNNSGGSMQGTTYTVGTKAPNELGIYDMSGNVWEWVWDIYGSYPSGAQTDPHGANSGSYRVIRGGGWFDHSDSCTVSYRSYKDATYAGSFIGFRICRVFCTGGR
ncbi:MAG TPA: formylglycine-generating enzyme family protein, partial [Candidatus Cloacimonadota bacterium]|nr:formylglycine-generating enzyme family protein [Candidatus Cloacimonadota bacterium]